MNHSPSISDSKVSRVILGMGHTGWSVARYFSARNQAFVCMDSRQSPPLLEQIKAEFPHLKYFTGGFDADLIAHAQEIIVSPGISLSEPVLENALRSGAKVVGDIELFVQQTKIPIVAITGSNAKSTVTTLVGKMMQRAGWRVAVGGNLGTPVLDLLNEPEPECYVLELSSFQLETTYSLHAAASVVLNVSEDHLDRHGSVKHYIDIKRRVFQGSGVRVFNADDSVVMSLSQGDESELYFGIQPSADNRFFGVICDHTGTWLCRGQQKLLNVNSLKLHGSHNHANVLAALALGSALGVPMRPMIKAAQEFEGLPHRCEWVRTLGGVQWINDSKGTNVGATLAAIEGFGALDAEPRIILIAGGIGKGADFGPLREVANRYLKAALLIGRDASIMNDALSDCVPVQQQMDLDSAVAAAADLARPGDIVLLSPACASFDMFSDYGARGLAFRQAVEDLS